MCVTLCFKLKQLPTDLFQRKNLARYNLHLVGGDGEQFATYLAKYYFYVLFKLFVKWGIKTQYRKNTNFLLLNYMVNFQAFGDFNTQKNSQREYKRTPTQMLSPVVQTCKQIQAIEKST